MTATNEGLSNSEIRYNYLIGSISEVIGELNLDGTISFVSPQVYDLLGYYPDEMVGTNFITFIHPDDVPNIKKIIKKTVKSKEVSLPRLRLKHKKGNYILVFAKGKLIKLDDKSRLIGIISGITKFNETEKKLEESEERYRSLVEDAQEGVWALDENENTIFVNPRICEMLGYTKNEMMGKNLHLFIPDSMKERIKGNRIRREKGIKETYDLEFLKKDGTIIYTKIKAAPIMSESRDYKGSFAYITDITTQKHAEDTLRESEEKFRTLFEIAPASIIVSDLESNITLFNQEFCNLHGITQPELVKGRKIKEFIAERDRPILKEAIIKTYREKPRGPIQYTMYKEDGTEFLAEGISSALKDKNGKNIGLIGVVQDITERVRSEQKLKESEEKYKSLFEQSPMAILLINFEGKIEDCNNATEVLFGYTKEELLGIDYLKFENFSLDTKLILAKSFSNFIKTGVPERSEIQMYRKDGKMIWISSYPISVKIAEISYILAVIQDITDRVLAEQELRENEGLLKNAQELAHIGHWKLNPSTMKVFGSDELFKIFGFPDVEATTEQFVAEFVHPEDREIILFHIRRSMEKGENWNIEHRIISKDGKEKWVHALCEPIKDRDGKVNILIGTVQDITERKIAEQKLKESEELFRTIFETAKDCIFIKDRSLQYIRINKAMEELFGVSSEDLLNKTDIELFGLEAGKHVMEIDQRVIQGEIIEEEPTKPINGIPHTFHTIKVPLKDTQGNIYGLCGFARDISDRKIFEQKLIESEEKFRTISEQSLMGILILQDDRYKYVNQAAADMFGYTVEELLDTPQGGFMNYIHPEDREFVREQATKKQMGMEDVVTKYQYRGLTKSSEIIWVQLYSCTITFEGKYADLITSIDLTERKKAQKALKESEKKYHALFENTPIGVTISDYEGHVIEINEQMKKLLGYELEEFQKLGVAAAYANDQDRIPFKNQLEEQGHIQDYEVDLKKKDGKVFPALLNSIKTNITGGPIYINTIRDITEKKEIEEIKTHLLTRFSHEFKTPLISINGFSDLLLSEYKNKLDEKMIGFLERIKNGGERLKLLVNAFMQSSQLGEKLTRLNLNKENLSNLIKLGVSEVEGLIHLRKHTINLDIPEKLIGEFDKEKIYSVITNLLMNAIKYTPLEGKIFIHSKIEEEDIFFSIKDSGIGLTEEDKRNLFKPFGKIERYGKGWDIISEGMGVGLHLSKEIVSLHGGKIWAESEGKNKGSTFYFSLPITNN